MLIIKLSEDSYAWMTTNHAHHIIILTCYANFLYFVYRIPYHFSHSINDYSSILHFNYLLKITSYAYDLCFIYPYLFISFYMCYAYIFQRSGYGKGLYVPEGTITIRDSDLYMYCTVRSKRGRGNDPNGANYICML